MVKIAIIEDDATISQMYRMKFEADGFDVRLAGNGIIGVSLIESFRPDVILLDIQMPEMDGAEALRRIRSHAWGKTIPVIVLTNLGEEEAPREMRSLGIQGYIVKANLTPRQVVAQVKAITAKP
ncbi:response regulator [Candidatus Saccharibacteria bacterium oral taxon 488]|jgi:multi-sensor hybrid histidine kinase|nr:response regulator [Candidatus Saccharibacteria bacterium oral taxon 488]